MVMSQHDLLKRLPAGLLAYADALLQMLMCFNFMLSAKHRAGPVVSALMPLSDWAQSRVAGQQRTRGSLLGAGEAPPLHMNMIQDWCIFKM